MDISDDLENNKVDFNEVPRGEGNEQFKAKRKEFLGGGGQYTHPIESYNSVRAQAERVKQNLRAKRMKEWIKGREELVAAGMGLQLGTGAGLLTAAIGETQGIHVPAEAALAMSLGGAVFAKPVAEKVGSAVRAVRERFGRDKT